jgi:hypothetical protein
MINADIKSYNYYQYTGLDAYGEQQLSEDVKGSVKMAIYLTSQFVQDNINYTGANYVGITYDAAIDNSYVIQYGAERLKVLYVNPAGNKKQVFLARV